MTTYDAATLTATGQVQARSAVALYTWNAQVSGALLTPLHICEVVLRNAVSDAIEQVYGPRWPWSTGFLQSLPNPPKGGGYNPQHDLVMARKDAATTGKVIPELKLVFWQKMFTRRHDTRLWKPHLLGMFSNVDIDQPLGEQRSTIYHGLEQLRQLRNRIAHHEPIFSRDLASDLATMIELIRFRSEPSAAWVRDVEIASGIIAQRP
jgi:hypothetical protein